MASRYRPTEGYHFNDPINYGGSNPGIVEGAGSVGSSFGAQPMPMNGGGGGNSRQTPAQINAGIKTDSKGLSVPQDDFRRQLGPQPGTPEYEKAGSPRITSTGEPIAPAVNMIVDQSPAVSKANVGVEQHETLQRGYNPSQQEIQANYPRTPDYMIRGGGVTAANTRYNQARAAAQGSDPDVYKGSVVDNQTGVKADYTRDANTGTIDQQGQRNLVNAGLERQNRIVNAQNSLSPSDQQRISPNAPGLAKPTAPLPRKR